MSKEEAARDGKPWSGDFDARAATWDEDPVKVARANAVADAMRRRLDLRPDTRALEYGCGTGLLTFALRPPLEHVTLADSSPGMLRVLETKIAAAGASGMRTLRLDLDVDPVPARRYDLVHSLMTLHHVGDTARILHDWSSMLAASGELAVADLDAEDGSFHGSAFTGHRGFDRRRLAERVEAAGFETPSFETVFRMSRPDGPGQKEFTVFLMVARKSAGPRSGMR